MTPFGSFLQSRWSYMKHVVLTEPLIGAEIKPVGEFLRFKARSEVDAEQYFPKRNRMEVPCPACGSEVAEPAFLRGTFRYRTCNECASLFVSPRPTQAALDHYYANSEAARLRGAYFTDTRTARDFHVVQSRADWIGQYAAQLDRGTLAFLDFGTVYPAILGEMRRMGAFSDMYALEVPPSVVAAVDAEDVILDEPPAKSLHVITAFEQLEHHFSPERVLQRLQRLAMPGAMLFITTRTCSGFDMLVLGDQNPYLFVPEHLNLLSIEGLKRLFERLGFELVELSTPGQLDVQLVSQAVKTSPAVDVGSFVRYVLNHRDEQTRAELQAFLQRNRLSSHVRITVRVPDSKPKPSTVG